MKRNLYIPIDITLDFEYECPLLIKKYDDLKLKIVVFDKGIPKDLTGQTINLILKKSDGTNIEKTITDITLNILNIALDNQSTVCSGIVEGEVQITDAAGQCTTNTFTFNVSNALATDITIKSEDDIETLEDMRALIATYKEEITALGDSVQATEALINIKNYISNNLTELTNKNATANANIAVLQAENNRSDVNIPALKNENDNADDKLDKFRLYDTTNLIQQVQNNTASLSENTQQSLENVENINNLKININTLKPVNKLLGMDVYYTSIASQCNVADTKIYIDNVKNAGFDTIAFCPVYASMDDTTLTRFKSDLQILFDYIKSKNFAHFYVKFHNDLDYMKNGETTDTLIADFPNYKSFIQYWVQQFTNYNVEMISIVNEPAVDAMNLTTYWNEIITMIKGYTNVAVGMSATVYGLYKFDPAVFTNFDWIGFNYYPMMRVNRKSITECSDNELLESFKMVDFAKATIQSFKKKYNKSIYITECGVPACTNATNGIVIENATGDNYNENEQLAYYKTVFPYLLSIDELSGIFIWASDGNLNYSPFYGKLAGEWLKNYIKY